MMSSPPPRSRPRLVATGQSMIELSLILPIVVYMLLGLVDVGGALKARSIIARAAQHGAEIVREASVTGVNGDSDVLKAIITTVQANGLPVAGIQQVTIYRDSTADISVGGSDPTTTVYGGDNLSADKVYTFSGGAVSSSSGTYNAGSAGNRLLGDWVGVQVTYRWTGITILFSGGLTIPEIANVQIDPNIVTQYGLTPLPITPTPPA